MNLRPRSLFVPSIQPRLPTRAPTRPLAILQLWPPSAGLRPARQLRQTHVYSTRSSVAERRLVIASFSPETVLRLRLDTLLPLLPFRWVFPASACFVPTRQA